MLNFDCDAESATQGIAVESVAPPTKTNKATFGVSLNFLGSICGVVTFADGSHGDEQVIWSPIPCTVTNYPVADA
jgi:hypothetical protein